MKVTNDGRDEAEVQRVAESEKRRAERQRRRESDERNFREVVSRKASETAAVDKRGKDHRSADVTRVRENGATVSRGDSREAAKRGAQSGPERTDSSVSTGPEASRVAETRSAEARNRDATAEVFDREVSDDRGSVSELHAGRIASQEDGRDLERDGGETRGDASASSDGGHAGAGGDGDGRNPVLADQAASELLNARLRPPEFALPASVAARERRPWPELVVDGIVRAVRFGHFQKRFDVRIELRAGVLGALSFHVASDSGRLSLAFESESDAALDAVRARFENLAEQLETAGIRFASVDYRRRSRGPSSRDGGARQ